MGWFETSLKEQIIHQIKNSWRSPHPYTNSGIEVILATHVLIQWLQTMAAMAWWLVTMVIPFPKASQSLKLSTTTTYIQTGCSGFISVLYTRYNDVPLCPFPENPPNIDDFSIEASIYVEFPVFDYWKIFWWRYPILAIRVSEGLFAPQLLAGLNTRIEITPKLALGTTMCNGYLL